MTDIRRTIWGFYTLSSCLGVCRLLQPHFNHSFQALVFRRKKSNPSRLNAKLLKSFFPCLARSKTPRENAEFWYVDGKQKKRHGDVALHFWSGAFHRSLSQLFLVFWSIRIRSCCFDMRTLPEDMFVQERWMQRTLYADVWAFRQIIGTRFC